ncbi:WXG100 family type VII secretion target [Clostridium felsineum]|uniref:Protein YukE n=1 Tax=Clostridium felsineum TaxID=36839 RepID=A0A1S8MC93_9CLOT|nr:WXG100 family type VII secretion target [Clostridium felsineum]MCR3759593.1 WXG100 family type VII secretion target [Clostridium felsineum]URZ02254.1 Protein YukE [Clostridium felsineum]URZ04995.1 Protein YukE [Clostridium felsineum]URZ10036.1 Protein YukE [Clostridium felsineum]URZ18066.1 Protein YukE [Clostridium felsineum DSM 794]
MALIKITPEELEQLAAKFSGASEESQQMVSTLGSGISNVQQNWAGVSATKFFGEYEAWSKTMTGYVQLLQQISTELKQQAQKFREADVR